MYVVWKQKIVCIRFDFFFFLFIGFFLFILFSIESFEYEFFLLAHEQHELLGGLTS